MIIYIVRDMALVQLTTDNLKIAFRKLQAQIYFDKNNLYNRELLAKWKRGKNDATIWNNLSALCNDIDQGNMEQYYKEIELVVLP